MGYFYLTQKSNIAPRVFDFIQFNKFNYLLLMPYDHSFKNLINLPGLPITSELSATSFVTTVPAQS